MLRTTLIPFWENQMDFWFNEPIQLFDFFPDWYCYFVISVELLYEVVPITYLQLSSHQNKQYFLAH